MRYLLRSFIFFNMLLGSLVAQEILFIGNSYTNGLLEPLQEFFDNAPAGYQFTYASITPGGRQLYTHSTTASTLATINAGNFDHVVIQEQSLTHSLAHRVLETNLPLTDAQNYYERYQNDFAVGGTSNNSTTTATAYWGMKQIIEAIQMGGNPAAQIHVFQTWGRHVSAASDVSWNAGTDEQKVARHLEQNILMARDALFFDPTARIARVGEAFQLSQATDPNIPIYATDGSHGNNEGKYLAAAILYQQITGLRAIDNSSRWRLGFLRAAHTKNIADSFYEEAVGVSGDFDGNLDYECADIDALVTEILAGTNNATFDLDGDGTVDVADRNAWLAEAGAAELASGNPYSRGDIDLSGKVDSTDLGLLLNNFASTTGVGYCRGDINADSDVDSTDLGLLLNVFGDSAASASAVPEPGSFPLIVFALLFFARFNRRN